MFRLIFISFISSAIFVFCSIPDPDSFVLSDGYGDWQLIPAAKENHNGTLLNMTVFYESLCPDSIDFFKEQFSKNWLSFYDYLNVTLVPYGKATQTRDKKGNYTFDCQHGEEECFANRIQACAIARIYEQRRKKLFSFISCYMSHKNKDKYGPKCAKPENIAFNRLKKCANNHKGNQLLAKYGNMTHDFRPKITWIPTIVFNGKYNSTENNQAASDLKSLLCHKLENKPKACK